MEIFYHSVFITAFYSVACCISLSSFLLENPHYTPVMGAIIATARLTALPLVTQDRAILDYTAQGHVAVV